MGMKEIVTVSLDGNFTYRMKNHIAIENRTALAHKTSASIEEIASTSDWQDTG